MIYILWDRLRIEEKFPFSGSQPRHYPRRRVGGLGYSSVSVCPCVCVCRSVWVTWWFRPSQFVHRETCSIKTKAVTVIILFSSVHNLFVFTVAVNEDGDTPLSSACFRGDLEMIKALINKHVDPSSKCLSVLLRCWWWSSTEPVNKAGDTPLSLACANGHLDTVKYLVNQHHCDPESKHWYIIMVHQLLHHSVHSYMYRYSQQGWWHPTLFGLQTWTLGSGQVSRHHSSLWYKK